jgi:hypothetical protein
MTCRLLLFCSVLLGTSAIWSQTVVLTGRVLDAADDSAIAGAQITVKRGNNKVGTGTSLADGSYEVKGLKKGDHIEAFYSRGGYKPNPMPSTVFLDNDNNILDVQLVHDTNEATYWALLSRKLKAKVESHTPDREKQLQLYEQTWSALGEIGLAPEARAQAARQLISAVPETVASHSIMSFATVDDTNLGKAEANIRAAVHGKTSLVNTYSIPSDIAVEIAADEFKKQSFDRSAQDKFSKDFEGVWGIEAGKQFRGELNPDCRPPCLTHETLQKAELLDKATKNPH